MVNATVRDEIKILLEHLDEGELKEVWAYIHALMELRLPADYDIENDPTIGMFSGSPTASIDAKEMFRGKGYSAIRYQAMKKLHEENGDL